MKKLVFAFIVVVVTNSSALGTLTEFSIEIDPVISHHYYYDEELEIGDVEDRINPIVLPEVTLASGDVFRVNVSFADGKFLKVVNGADAVGITLHYITGLLLGTGSSSQTNDAIAGLRITNYENVLNTIQSNVPWCSKEELTDIYWFGKAFYFERDEGEIIDGSLFGDFTAEFTAPTMVGGEPFPAESYTYNSIDIKAFLFNTAVDKNVFVVVPEPATVLLLGLGGLALLRKRRVK